MHFHSVADFIAMGGYGFFVWLSYGVTVLLLVLLILASRADRKKIIRQIQQRQKRVAKLNQAAQAEANHQSVELQL